MMEMSCKTTGATGTVVVASSKWNYTIEMELLSKSIVTV